MKKLLFIFLIIFSSQSFAKSVVGKVLLCESEMLEFYDGYVFLDEEYVEHIWVYKGKVSIDKKRYYTGLRYIKIKVVDDVTVSIYRASLKTSMGQQCSIQKSKDIVVEFFREKVNEILNNNQL